MSDSGLRPSAVALVILNYRSGGDTIACLQAVYAMPDAPGRVIVVDNDSRDGSPERITKAWECLAGRVVRLGGEGENDAAAVLVTLSENVGYAAGNNVGIRLALQDSACRAIWILNNDTEPAPGSLEALCARLDDEPGGGIAGSTLVYAHSKNTVQCAAGFALNRLTGATPALRGGNLLEKVQNLLPAAVEKKLGYICGASMLVRRGVLESAGLLPEEYFLYYEDAAFCLNAQKAGYQLAWAPHSIVLHKEGGSSGAKSETAGRAFRRSRLVDYLALRNRAYLIRRYFPCCLPIAMASYVGVMVNRLRRGQGRRVPLVFKALADGVRGRLGKPEAAVAREEASKILFLTIRADFGGGPEHLWQLLQHAPQSVRPYVACPEDYPYYERYREIVGSDHIFKLPHRLFNLRKFWQLRFFCREHGISILHAHGKGAGLYARLLAMITGLPCVYTFHGVHIDGYTPLKHQAYRVYERFLSLFTEVGIAVAEGEKKQIIAEGLMPGAKLRLISNGVNLPGVMTDSGCPLPAPYMVVTLSRFDYQKNNLFLIDIARALKKRGRLEEFQITAVGDGPDRQAVASAAQLNGWSHIVLCSGASTLPHSFFEGALCYLSTSRWEGMPLAVLEAMAHGLPVVATDVVGNRDALDHEKTGFLYPEGDAPAAATALCRLVDDPALRRTMGDNAREYVLRNHSMEEMIAKTFDVLQEVARRN